MTESRRTPNRQFRDARLRLFGTREALAEAANAYLSPAFLLSPHDIGKIERGVVTFPRAPRRAALRQALQAPSDEAIGFFDSRRPGPASTGGVWPLMADAHAGWTDGQHRPARRGPFLSINGERAGVPVTQTASVDPPATGPSEYPSQQWPGVPTIRRMPGNVPYGDDSSAIPMQRRDLLKAVSVLAASENPLVHWEALRHGICAAVDPDLDQWDQIVADYGNAYYRQPADQVLATLRADLTVVQTMAGVAAGAARNHLLQVMARLSVLVAQSMVAAGQTLVAARWWRNAQSYADKSGDADSIVLTRAWDVVNGCYDGRPPAETLRLADDVLPLTHGRATSASCGLLAGRAQALSLAGEHTEAIATVRQLNDLAEQLPSSVTRDTGSLWGWPEHRLRHTEAWVYAHAGQVPEASRAREQAEQLYPASLLRLRTQVQLHHAAALIRGGCIPDGLRQAADALDQLPSDQHNELLRTVARQVTGAVPAQERNRPMYRELTERVVA